MAPVPWVPRLWMSSAGTEYRVSGYVLEREFGMTLLCLPTVPSNLKDALLSSVGLVAIPHVL